MELSSLIKVVAAFVAGLVVALGSALIYVRVNEPVHPAPVLDTALPHPPLAAGTENSLPPIPKRDEQVASPPGQAVVAKPVQAPAPKKLKPLMTVLESHRHPSAPVAAPRKAAAIEIARTNPPMPAAAAPAIPGVKQQQPTIPSVTPAQQSIPGVHAAPAEPQPSPPDQPESEYTPAPAVPAAPQPHVVTLTPGTNLVIRLGETLSSDHNYTGDTFRATLESRVVMDGFIIADKGSKVLGRIVNAQKAGRVEGVSDLNLMLTEINTTDGQRVSIETSTYDKRASASTGEDAAKIAGGAALGAIIGGIAGGGKGAAIGAGAGGVAGAGTVLVTRGKPAVLPTETRLTFRLASPVTITEKLN